MRTLSILLAIFISDHNNLVPFFINDLKVYHYIYVSAYKLLYIKQPSFKNNNNNSNNVTK